MEFKFRTIFSGNIEASVIAEFSPAEEQTHDDPGCDEDIEICAVIILGMKTANGWPSEDDDADMLQYLHDRVISDLEVKGLEHIRKVAADEQD